MIELDIVNFLQSAGLTLYPGSVPVTANFPCVVYQRISTPTIKTHSSVEFETPRFQFSCYAKTYSETLATAQTLKDVLDLNQVNFILATKESEFDLKDIEIGIYRRVLDFFIWHEPIVGS